MSLFNRISGGRAPNNSNNNYREVCKFYLEGRCRFGDQCRYYHPPRDQTSSQSRSLPYSLKSDDIRADLTDGKERPTWPLSAYAPGRDAPRQLLEGMLEQSPEELRVQYYLARPSGNTQQYEQNERDGYAQSNQQAQSILNDIDGAIKYIIDGKDQHPNREDMVIKGPPAFPWSERPSIGQIAQPTGDSTFGQPSTFGRGTPFGQSSAPTTQQASTFGRGTPFGQSSTPTTQQASTFGQPSTFGSSPASVNQAQTAGSTFGQSSNLGAQQTSSFGAPSMPSAGGSTFGQPSPFGRATPFGQTSTFGQPSTFGQSSTLGTQQTPSFGAPSMLGAGGSTFGQPSTSSRGTPFGQTTTPATQQPSTFGQASSSGSSPFGGGQSASNTQTSASRQPPTSWRGGPVTKEGNLYFYRNATGKQERIWFPEGPPGPNPDVEAASPATYDDSTLSMALMDLYGYVKEHGTFKDGLVPEIPPKREWVAWEV